MKISIFLLSDIFSGVGGAEKRFFGLWLNLQKRGIDCRFVTYERMLDEILKTGEYDNYQKYKQNIKLIPRLEGDLFQQSKMFYDAMKHDLNRNEILHFIMFYPIPNKFPNPTLYSDPASSMSDFNFKGKLLAGTKILLADMVDILDPIRGDSLRNKIFWNRQKVKITSNTYVDIDKYTALPISAKKNWFVILGRFEPVKQILNFVRSIPAIHQKTKEIKLENCKYFILGHGSLETEMKQILKQTDFSEIDAEMKYEPQPSGILARSKVVFSLQKHTNFPSKSLAEALAAGCLPIVTDNGSTRRMARPEFSFYVPENFTGAMLAGKVSEIFAFTPEEMQKKSNLAAKFAKEELSPGKMTDYYLDVYQKLHDTKK